jgi:hypothetical protein
MKLRAKIKEIETKSITQRINDIKNWFFKKINKINKPLAKLTKRKTEKTQISKLEMKNGTSQQIPQQFRQSLENTFNILIYTVLIYILINWKI